MYPRSNYGFLPSMFSMFSQCLPFLKIVSKTDDLKNGQSKTKLLNGLKSHNVKKRSGLSTSPDAKSRTGLIAMKRKKLKRVRNIDETFEINEQDRRTSTPVRKSKSFKGIFKRNLKKQQTDKTSSEPLYQVDNNGIQTHGRDQFLEPNNSGNRGRDRSLVRIKSAGERRDRTSPGPDKSPNEAQRNRKQAQVFHATTGQRKLTATPISKSHAVPFREKRNPMKRGMTLPIIKVRTTDHQNSIASGKSLRVKRKAASDVKVPLVHTSNLSNEETRKLFADGNTMHKLSANNGKRNPFESHANSGNEEPQKNSVNLEIPNGVGNNRKRSAEGTCNNFPSPNTRKRSGDLRSSFRKKKQSILASYVELEEDCASRYKPRTSVNSLNSSPGRLATKTNQYRGRKEAE